MSNTGVAAFDKTVQTTNVWLNELMEELDWGDRHRAYVALRAVLHTLRDRLPVEEVADLGAQLPILIRGLYYEGWHPSGKPLKQKREDFLAHIGAAFKDSPEVPPEGVAWGVFKVLQKHVTSGEIRDIKSSLPAALRSLCSPLPLPEC